MDNPAPFGNPLQFEITFECLQPLEDDLEWKVVYVGSAKSSTHDQILDEILVGPVPLGINKFILQADPPNASNIPDSDILGVTVILVTCSYREKEFLRVGYYVNNEYVFGDEETHASNGVANGNSNGNANAIANGNGNTTATENGIAEGSADPTEATPPQDREPPRPLDLTKVVRTILADKPRVTRFQIPWGDTKDEEMGQGQQQNDNGGDTGMSMPQAGEINEEDDDDIMKDEDMMEDEEEEDEEDGLDDMVATE